MTHNTFDVKCCFGFVIMMTNGAKMSTYGQHMDKMSTYGQNTLGLDIIIYVYKQVLLVNCSV